MQAILIIVAVVCLAAAILMTILSARRGKALSELNAKLIAGERRLHESRSQLETKCKEAEEVRSKLDRTRDEAKKAKKKAFELEQQDKEKAVVPPVVVSQDDDILMETRAQARQATEAAARAAEEKNSALEQLEKLKTELATAKQALKARHEDALKAERGETERVKKLESEMTDLQEKLEAARRKSRTDAQVYRITKSKLDLAFEKIANLERMLGTNPSNPPADALSESNEAAPSPVRAETEPLSTQKPDI